MNYANFVIGICPNLRTLHFWITTLLGSGPVHASHDYVCVLCPIEVHTSH
jgi:hypothetical protein